MVTVQVLLRNAISEETLVAVAPAKIDSAGGGAAGDVSCEVISATSVGHTSAGYGDGTEDGQRLGYSILNGVASGNAGNEICAPHKSVGGRHPAGNPGEA